jgi:hypothetical protein
MLKKNVNVGHLERGIVPLFWKKKEEIKTEVHSWFNYSIMLPAKDEDEHEVMIIGNYIIKNTGTQTITNPLICIRTIPSNDVRLGGKIGSVTHTALTIDGTNAGAWEYIHNDWKEKSLETGEHWLKPKQQHQLAPGESIAFSHELSFSLQQKEKVVNVDGFAYFDELKDGTSAINKIMINL